ncbi:regulator of cell morphogenesis and NO signaling [Orenia metallireducens]|jgi:regulator of cell morphogenesis and NO signaling|uniref:Regulator of cell morphogenesis and NO signaling n=1 Tax=Orenia metallireducens TaxID=1413210 RepID=A0A285F388_9FIRM|nr:iron-sulfur cluster repair di-iron protein [Orenia metallireducens]PRX34824.1 regulator of cell morphogenesis and NO signaling [Orenia metallireducens]SNY05769.1 regulator of cell morphogenesis and NO signaling [Orenia metallireducens]
MKENKFTIKDRIGTIVAEFPKAVETFMKYNIDFCCGGDRPLQTALEEGDLPQEKVIEELNQAYCEFDRKAEDIDWRQESMTDLIDYVVNTHHQFMREELPVLNELLNRILKAHYLKEGELLGRIHKLFYQLRGEIEEHLIKEEKLLFPAIKEYEAKGTEEKLEKALKIMAETEDEHDHAGDILKEVRSLTDNYQLPEGVCRTFALTYDKFEEIEQDLFQHIHLENNILFERLKNINS